MLNQRIAAEKKKKEELRKRAAKKIIEHTLTQKDTPASTTATAPQSIDASDCNTSSTHNNPASITVLVNKKHCIIPLDYIPADLVTMQNAKVSAKIQPDLQRMFADAKKNGYALQITSGYRSYQTQVRTYNYWVKHAGSSEKADTYSARPGYSEHQTGLVVDVQVAGCALTCFTKTSAYRWLKDNAHKYGFIERYPAGKTAVTGYVHESWHYRYIGTKEASTLKKSQVATLEELWSLPGGEY